MSKKNHSSKPANQGEGNQTPNDQAKAPYNFIPLNQKVYFVDDKEDFLISNGESDNNIPLWQTHDQYLSDCHTGSIEISLTTDSPLFIRAAEQQNEHGKWKNQPARYRDLPYSLPNGRLAIPGSSIRGMFRSFMEIITYSKLTTVPDRHLFWRDLANKSRSFYRNQFKSGIQCGFLQFQEGQWNVLETKMHEVNLRDVDRELGIGNGNGQHMTENSPKDPDQYREIFFDPDSGESRNIGPEKFPVHRNFIEQFSVRQNQERYSKQGYLYFSGHMQGKKTAYIIEKLSQDARPISISEQEIKFLVSEEQSDFTLKHFPQSESLKKLKDFCTNNLYNMPGDIVFYIKDKDANRILLGRTPNFKLPYRNSLHDMLPKDHLETYRVDMAEALFGRIIKNESNSSANQILSNAIKGRLRFEDAIAFQDENNQKVHTIENKESWTNQKDNPILSKILAEPKISYYPHYLTSKNGKQSKSPPNPAESDSTIRGFKRYWHHKTVSPKLDPENDLELGDDQNRKNYQELFQDFKHKAEQNLEIDSNSDTSQLTWFRPVKKKITYTTTIHFHNLNDIELGALLTALDLPGTTMRHQIGMGKPYGLGRLKVAIKSICLMDFENRYKQWETSNDTIQDVDTIKQKCMNAFQNAIKTHENMKNVEFWEMKRMKDLKILCDHQPFPKDDHNQYLRIKTKEDEKSEFKRNPLPYPDKLCKPK